MGFNSFNCSQSSCCFCCIYKRCFRACSKNKTTPEDPEKSPPPSIALTIIDEQTIQDQLSLFHFQKTSERRTSHPNQAKWVEEYERRKSLTSSPSPSVLPGDSMEMDDVPPPETPPSPSPVMQYPVIPPGILFI